MFLDLLQPYTHTRDQLKIKPSAQCLLISIAMQELALVDGEEVRKTYQVSTSSKPPGCRQDSGGTPLGLHRIARKIGDGEPIGGVFKGRVSIGKGYWELSKEEQARNLITTRILWLEGLEPDRNRGEGCDSFQRYIYIHGTNHEDRIGSQASGGCIQLRNSEMIELFDSVAEGDLVYIGESGQSSVDSEAARIVQ